MFYSWSRSLGMAVVLAGMGKLEAASINIPNGSFESPVTGFVDTNIDDWQKTPKPDWYTQDAVFHWTQLTGLFANTPVGSSDHLDNCDSNQAAYIFALPQAGFFQDYDSTDWSNSVPTHAFNALFEPGRAYTLTVAVNGGGGGMSNGTTLQISMYYRDLMSNMVTVAATTITNTPETFPNHTHLVDFQAQLPVVRTNDPWAGQHIGVQIISTVSSNMQGGYWDMDNVRLLSVSAPVLSSIMQSNNTVQFLVQSEPGFPIEVLASDDPTLPIASWSSLGTVTNSTGNLPFVDTSPDALRRFYRGRLLQ